jgi:tripartite-type tricarboxylate transporter receptor subunit TctC
MKKRPSTIFFRTVLLIPVLMATLLCPIVASAQTYPSKPIRVVIPWPPGGSNDIVGRIVVQPVSASLGQPLVIDNRGGAAGTIGSYAVAKAAPDGYTMLITSATHLANAHLYSKLPYDPLKDFVGVSPLGRQVGILAVHPSLPVNNVKEFINLAKSRPDEIVYGSAGNASFTHLMMVLFTSMTGTRMLHVPYKGGAPAGISIETGETKAMIATLGSFLPQLRGKRVRALAVTSSTRVEQFPDIPTIAESGVPGYEFTSWVGAFVPAGTPRNIVDRLNAEFKKANGDSDVRAKLIAAAHDSMYLSPDEFEQVLKADHAKYGKLIRMTGAKID